MSQIRKSASFRSRIPIRRTKPVPRRCYSPEPYVHKKKAEMHDQSYNNYETKPQHINKQKMKRHRHIATATATATAQHTTKQNNEISNTNFPVPLGRPKTIYSSSSYSSSDESQESEAPPQVTFSII